MHQDFSSMQKCGKFKNVSTLPWLSSCPWARWDLLQPAEPHLSVLITFGLLFQLAADGQGEKLLFFSDSCCPFSSKCRQNGWVLLSLTAILHHCFTNQLERHQFYTTLSGSSPSVLAVVLLPSLLMSVCRQASYWNPEWLSEGPLGAISSSDGCS